MASINYLKTVDLIGELAARGDLYIFKDEDDQFHIGYMAGKQPVPFADANWAVEEVALDAADDEVTDDEDDDQL